MPVTSTSFKPGQSGNPSGRPKRSWTWAEELTKAADETEAKTGKTFRELISKRVIVEAASGNMIAAKEAFNRMDGMPRQDTAMDITTGGEPLQIVITEQKKEDQ